MWTQLEPFSDLQEKVVLITGASSGLGWDFCINLANAGCKVIAAARRTHRLTSLCDLINNNDHSSSTPRAVALALDVTADAEAIEAAVQKAWGVFGHIDCLINNAGIRGMLLFLPSITLFCFLTIPNPYSLRKSNLVMST